MVYISGEEMTKYCMDLVLEKWIKPHVDISAWEFYDLSCKARDDTEDQCLRDAVSAGARIGAIFKGAPTRLNTRRSPAAERRTSPLPTAFHLAPHRPLAPEPTVTPTEEQRVALGLKKAWGSPNGAMRRGWNGITISRDTVRPPRPRRGRGSGRRAAAPPIARTEKSRNSPRHRPRESRPLLP